MSLDRSEVSEDAALVKQAVDGDQDAIDRLLTQYREPLKRMVALRLDPAIYPRVDASDIVQETLFEAAHRMPDYLQRKPMPFGLWLRKTAMQRLIMERRRHKGAAGRTVSREVALPEKSSLLLAQQVMAKGSSPSQQVGRREQVVAIRRAVGQLPETDREVVLMYWIEGLNYAEIGAVLGIEEATARKRQARALVRLGRIMREHGLG
jgi:RNA polymerase sigma-70 factor (ECF subfamily)